MNSKHLRLSNVNHKLKIVRQRLEQKMIDHIIYINDLKSQLFEKASEYNLYNNLMKFFRQLFKDEIFRRINAILSRRNLKEIVRLAEKKFKTTIRNLLENNSNTTQVDTLHMIDLKHSTRFRKFVITIKI